MGERVLVHLEAYTRYADAYEVPAEATQDGIAAALGISRAHAALELKRLKAAGRVEERMAHVPEGRTRRKVYFLLPAGREVARRMREHARAKRVTLAGPDGSREASGLDAIEALRRVGLREAEAIQQVLAADIVHLGPAAASPSAPPVRAPPFFGRDRELRDLRAWLAPDEGPVAVVVGVAGIGKTALVARALREEARPVLLRRAYAHDDVHGLLSSLADFLARNGRRRLKGLLAKAAYDPAEALAVAREDLAGSVVAVDDLHASAAAEGLLRSLLEGDVGFKVLVASREVPRFYDARDRATGRVNELALDGLEDAPAIELLASRGTRFGADDLRRALRAARGHPLALELLAGAGPDGGALEAERFVLETVLDGLDDAAEALLRTFVVLRRPAPSPEALGGTVSQVRRLTRLALLQHRDDGYQIHDLVQEFFRARMSEADRLRANERAAVYWESRGDALEAAHHRLEAGDLDGAAALLRSAEAHAEGARAGDLEAALLRLPEDRRPRRLLAETQMFLGKFAEARAGLEALARDGPPAERVRARVQLGRIENRLGAYARAREILEAAAREAVALGDAELEGEGLRALGAAERKLGEMGAAIAHVTRASELLPGGSREKVRALTDLGAAFIATGDLGRARACLQEAKALAREGSREEAAVENNLAIVLSREGNPGEAAATFQRSADLAIRAGEVRFAAYALANAADNLLGLGRTQEAGGCAERALALASTIGDPVALSTARANLGLVHAQRGEWARAEEQLLSSVDLIARLENPYSLAGRYEELARVYEAQGRAADAAPWRARAEALFARIREGGGGAPPAAMPGEASDVRPTK